MKKAFFTLAVALLAATGAWAQTTFTADNLKYTVTDETTHTVELTGYEGALAGEVNIPATVTNESTEYSVTSIGSSAFSWCSQLTAVTIPEGVATIGSYAFERCSSLTAVTIPASAINIGGWVFDYCSALTAIHVAEGNATHSSEDGVLFNKDKTTLVCYPIGKPETTYTVPATVTTFTTSAFENCTALAQINLPNSLTDMASRTFYGCTSLKEVTLPDGVTQLMGFNFTDCSALEKVTLPEGITYIGSGAFKNCSALTELTVWAITPPTLESDAFTGVSSSLVVKVPAEGLPAYQTADIWKDFELQGNGQAPFFVGNLKYRVTSQTENMVEVMGYQTAPTDALTIPANVTYNEVTYTVTGIKEQVFANCSALTSVTLPDGLTTIGAEAFFNCTSLTGITIPNTVTSIGIAAFKYSGLTTASIGNGVTTIGERTFEYCSALATVNIGSGLTTIGNAAFANCTSLTGITLPDGLTTIGAEAFFNCTSLTGITIPNTVTSIGIAAFKYSGLTTASIGNGVTTIGSSAFSNCTSLTGITLPDGLTTIGAEAFFNCTSLTGITIPNTVTSIGIAAFKYSGLTTASIGNGVTTIGEEAFQDCSSLATVSIGSGLTTIGNNAFYACWALTQFNVDEANEAYCSDGGVLFNKDKTTLLQYPAGKTETTYAVPTGVTSIAKYAFAGSNALTEVTLPEGLTEIAEYAFAWCRNLTKISLPKSLDNIGNMAFNECTGLTEMTVLATTPPTVGTDVFLNVSRTIPVYVPAASLAAYQAADVWSEFTNLQGTSTTGVPAAAMPESIRMQGGTLHNPQQLHLTLYDMQGRQVYSGNDATVSLNAGVYVMCSNGASCKVVF